jgi:type IV secretory pathway protease TraF
MMAPIHSNPAHPAQRPHANPNAISFSASKNPESKGFLQKVVPVIRRVGAVAGKVSTVAGKVAIVASIL